MTRKIKADLHNHFGTASNLEGMFNPVADKAYKKLGKGGILGLINFEDKRYEQFEDLRGYERVKLGNALYLIGNDLLIVKGQEIPTNQGHVLALGLEKNIISGRNLEGTLDEIKAEGGITILDHPSYAEGTAPYITKLIKKDKEKATRILSKVDGWEVHNGEASTWLPIPPIATKPFANLRSQLTYNWSLWNLPITQISSSDGHSIYEIGSNYTEMEIPDEYFDLKNSSDVKNLLKESMKSAREKNLGLHKKMSIRGGLDHIADLAILTAFKKIGLRF